MFDDPLRDPLLGSPALAGCSSSEKPQPSADGMLSSPPERKIKLCSAGDAIGSKCCGANLYCRYCVYVRYCHTISGDKSVSSVAAWTGGVAERSPGTRLFSGLSFHIINDMWSVLLDYVIQILKLTCVSLICEDETSESNATSI